MLAASHWLEGTALAGMALFTSGSRPMHGWWGRGNVNRRLLNFCESSMSDVCSHLALTVLVATIDAQWEGMGDVGSARYEPALLPPCLTIRVLSYSN